MPGVLIDKQDRVGRHLHHQEAVQHLHRLGGPHPVQARNSFSANLIFGMLKRVLCGGFRFTGQQRR